MDGVDIHYTASSPATSIVNIAAYQVGPGAQEAFPAIAYHIVVPLDGMPRLCHDLDVRVWHNGAHGANDRRVGICWVGNLTPTVAQVAGLAEAILWCEEQLNRHLDVRGHGDAFPTSCPGPTWGSWKHDLYNRVRG